MAVVPNGRPAVTHWSLRERFRSYDLLDVKLETGRTHQIRVHLSHGNHPVLGDPEYGGRDNRLRGIFGPERPFARKLLDSIERQALHACALQFCHPVSGEKMAFEADLPADFSAALDLLRSEGL
jgi:23S rRNA pseudouridine1911/1915/1917 synthase